jgi:hypothetical protein
VEGVGEYDLLRPLGQGVGFDTGTSQLWDVNSAAETLDPEAAVLFSTAVLDNAWNCTSPSSLFGIFTDESPVRPSRTRVARVDI